MIRRMEADGYLVNLAEHGIDDDGDRGVGGDAPSSPISGGM